MLINISNIHFCIPGNIFTLFFYTGFISYVKLFYLEYEYCGYFLTKLTSNTLIYSDESKLICNVINLIYVNQFYTHLISWYSLHFSKCPQPIKGFFVFKGDGCPAFNIILLVLRKYISVV